MIEGSGEAFRPNELIVVWRVCQIALSQPKWSSLFSGNGLISVYKSCLLMTCGGSSRGIGSRTCIFRSHQCSALRNQVLPRSQQNTRCLYGQSANAKPKMIMGVPGPGINGRARNVPARIRNQPNRLRVMMPSDRFIKPISKSVDVC